MLTVSEGRRVRSGVRINDSQADGSALGDDDGAERGVHNRPKQGDSSAKNRRVMELARLASEQLQAIVEDPQLQGYFKRFVDHIDAVLTAPRVQEQAEHISKQINSLVEGPGLQEHVNHVVEQIDALATHPKVLLGAKHVAERTQNIMEDQAFSEHAKLAREHFDAIMEHPGLQRTLKLFAEQLDVVTKSPQVREQPALWKVESDDLWVSTELALQQMRSMMEDSGFLEHLELLGEQMNAMLSHPKVLEQAEFVAEQLQAIVEDQNVQEHAELASQQLKVIIQDLRLQENSELFAAQVQAVMTDPKVQQHGKFASEQLKAIMEDPRLQKYSETFAELLEAVNGAQTEVTKGVTSSLVEMSRSLERERVVTRSSFPPHRISNGRPFTFARPQLASNHISQTWHPIRRSEEPQKAYVPRLEKQRGRRSWPDMTGAADGVPNMPTPAPTAPPLAPRVGGFAALAVADEIFRIAFRGTGLPHSLAGGVVLVSALIAARSAGEAFHRDTLAPGAALLLSWMPVFFAPALVLLPLAEPVVATARDAAALAAVLVGGLGASLVATAAAVKAVSGTGRTSSGGAAAPVAAPAPKVPFGSPLLKPLVFSTGVAGAAACAGCAAFAQLYFVCATLASFVGGSRLAATLATSDVKLKRGLARAFHPVAQTAVAVTVAIRLLAAASKIDAAAALRSYGALCGAPLQRLLGASVLALACGVYGRRKDVRDNWRAVSAGTVAGVGVGLYGTALAARLVNLPHAARYALLPRCITSPLAIAVCSALGTDAAAAVALVVLTGVLGAAFGPATLDALGTHDPVARGLAMGAAAHGIGTAQMGNEPDAQPFAAIAMSLVGAASVIAAATPASRALLLRAAGL